MESSPDKHGESGEPIPPSLKWRKMSNNWAGGERGRVRPRPNMAQHCSVSIWKQTSAPRGAHLNSAWPCPATYICSLVSLKSSVSPPPRFPLVSLTLFNSAEGLNAAQENGGAAGCRHRKSWVQHKVRGVNSRVSIRGMQQDLGQIFKSNSYCVFSPVWSGRWAEGTTILRNAATGGNMIVLSLLQQCVVSFT